MKVLTKKNCIICIAAVLMACNTKKGGELPKQEPMLKIKGSDTEFEMVQKLCAEFLKTDSMSFTIEGGGTELGINALMDGKVDMATASREITDVEKNGFKNKNMTLLPIMFATDAVAIITHPRLGVDSLTLDQLSKIFNGEFTNWKDVGGPDRKITVYTRNVHSGTYLYVKNKLLQGEFLNSAIICTTTRNILESVSKDSTGIGYTGAGFLMDNLGKPSNKIWAMPLSIDNKHYAYSPYQVQEVKNGNYPLTRPLYQYYKMPLNKKVKDFIMFELTQRGQNLIRNFGYFPISDYQKEINKLNGLEMY